jgi:hypothetical protein
MVGDHQDRLPGQLTRAEAPEQVEQAVVLTRGHQGDARQAAGLGEAVLHRERLRNLLREAPVEPFPLRLRRRFEDQAHEQPALVGRRVLVGVDDVAIVVGEEAGDARHDPRSVRQLSRRRVVSTRSVSPKLPCLASG